MRISSASASASSTARRPLDHRPLDPAVDRHRAHHAGDRLDVRRHALGAFCLRSIHELEETTPLDGAVTGQRRGRSCRDSEFRMIDDRLLGERANPSQYRPAKPVADRGQVVLDEHLR